MRMRKRELRKQIMMFKVKLCVLAGLGVAYFAHPVVGQSRDRILLIIFTMMFVALYEICRDS